MAGIFQGLGNIFTGGGGTPDFEGMADRDLRQLQNSQIANSMSGNAMLQDWRNNINSAWNTQQGLLPQVYDMLGQQAPQVPWQPQDYSANAASYMNDPTWQQQRMLELGEQYKGASQDTFSRNLAASQQALSQLMGPSFNMEGMDSMRQTLLQAQQMQQLPLSQLEGMDAMRGAVNRAQLGLDRPEFQIEGLPQARQNVQMAQQLLTPALLRLGLQGSASGQWGNDPNSPEMQARGLSSQYLTQAGRALRGEEGIDPTLQRQLGQEEAALRNQLQASLGADYATSTPGMSALADFAKRRGEAYYSSNQDLAQRATQAYGGLNQANLATQQALYGVLDPLNRATGQLGTMSNEQQQAQLADRQARFQNLLSSSGQLAGASGDQARMQEAERMGRFASLMGANQQLAGASAQEAQIRQNQINAQMANYLNSSQALQGILQQGMQGNLAYEQARNTTPFQTLGGFNQLYGQQMGLQGQQLANTGARLNNLYGGVMGAFRDTGLSSAAALAAQLGTANAALPWQQANWQGDVTSDLTNQNNMFWRAMGQSAGSSIGSMAGIGMAGNMKGGAKGAMGGGMGMG
jgi:hypothetical protein